MNAPQKPTSAVEFEQVLQYIQVVIGNEQQRTELLKVNGDNAQKWLDLFQLVAEYPNIARDLRSWIFKLMIRLSRKSGLHPQCLTIRDVEKLDDYPVAGGAFGDVWKGRIGQQLVCLKMIRAFKISDVRQILKDYMQEAIIWCQLNHPNLLPFIGIYYLDTKQRQLCLVSPWMEQGNLVQFLKNTSSDLVDHDVLAYDVACGLSYLHGENIVHGDLKGVNILITPDLRACIADFGLSRVSATLLLLSETSRSKGTMRWLSPELLIPGPGCVSSKESDVYAYACVCYEIFTGRIPFYETNEAAIFYAVLMQKQRPSHPDNCAVLRGSMWDMMVACWNEAPSLRPSIEEILACIYEMNADRQLEPASEWNDPIFKHIWNNAERPPVFQVAESILPRSEHIVPPLSSGALPSTMPSHVSYPYQNAGLDSVATLPMMNIDHPHRRSSSLSGSGSDASVNEIPIAFPVPQEPRNAEILDLEVLLSSSLENSRGPSAPSSSSFHDSSGYNSTEETTSFSLPMYPHHNVEQGYSSAEESSHSAGGDMGSKTVFFQKGCAFIDHLKDHSQQSVLIDDPANVKSEIDDIEMTLPPGEVEKLTSRSTSPYELDHDFTSIDDPDDIEDYESQQSLPNNESGAPNFNPEDLNMLLDCTEQVVPTGSKGWLLVKEVFNVMAKENGRPERSTRSLENKYKQLVDTFYPSLSPHIYMDNQHFPDRKVGSHAVTRSGILQRRNIPTFFCRVPGCESQGFTTYHDLLYHMHSHSHIDQRPYQCQKCNKCFRSRSDLTRHGKSTKGCEMKPS